MTRPAAVLGRDADEAADGAARGLVVGPEVRGAAEPVVGEAVGHKLLELDQAVPLGWWVVRAGPSSSWVWS